MNSYFVDKVHRARLLHLMVADGTHPGDCERISLFYIVSGNTDLYYKRNAIYDFKEHLIKQCLVHKEVDFSSGMKAMIRLGFNLYNGYQDSYTTPYDLFGNLGKKNQFLAENAIHLRFHEDDFYDLFE